MPTQWGIMAQVPSQTWRSGASANCVPRGKALVVVLEHGRWVLMKCCLRCERVGQLRKAVGACPAGFRAHAKRRGAGQAEIRFGRQAPGPRFPGL